MGLLYCAQHRSRTKLAWHIIFTKLDSVRTAGFGASMSYTITEEKQFEQTSSDVYIAALKAVSGLEGKLTVEKSPSELSAKFHKTIHGKVLGDRTQLTAQISESGGGCTMHIEVYPLDAVGRKLQFGARKGVSKTIMTWFCAHLDHHLSKSKA